MKKIIYLSILASSLFVISCKKENTPPSSSGNGTGSSTGLTPFTNVYGTMGAVRSLTNNTFTGVPDTSYSNVTWFFNAPQNNWMFVNLTSMAPAGNVSLNAVQLKLYVITPLYFYVDTTGTLNLKNGANWQVSGASPIPALTYSPVLPWQSYTGYAQLPDSIHKTQNSVITLSGITGADSVSISISDGSNISGHSYTTGKVIPSAGSITILPIHTSGLNNTTMGSLSVSIFKFKQVGFSGKNFVFLNDLEFKKTVEIDNY